MLRLEDIYSKQFMENFDPYVWTTYEDKDVLLILRDTAKKMLKALDVPGEEQYDLHYKRNKEISDTATIESKSLNRHTIYIRDNYFPSQIDKSEKEKAYDNFDLCAAVADNFTNVVHECVHIAQDHTMVNNGIGSEKLKDNCHKGFIGFRLDGKVVYGKTYLKDFSDVKKGKHLISKWLHQYQYCEREAYAYTFQAVNLFLDYFQDRLSKNCYSEIRLQSMALDPAYIKMNLEHCFQCENIEKYIDESIHLLCLPLDKQTELEGNIPPDLLYMIKSYSYASGRARQCFES